MYWSLAQHQYIVHVLGKFQIAQIHLRSLDRHQEHKFRTTKNLRVQNPNGVCTVDADVLVFTFAGNSTEHISKRFCYPVARAL